MIMENPNSLPPGFRFHPTDEELVLHYLQNKAASKPCPVSVIAEVDIYKFDPWELPGKAIMLGEREWYFFSPRDRKYPNGIRPNRAAGSGYWKATGTDKPIHSSKENKNIGIKKALVFYKGRPPKGLKTNWIMHEYRLAEVENSNSYRPMKFRNNSMRLDDWVLCRIYKKNNHIQTVPSLIEGDQEESGIDDFDSSNFLNLENKNNILKPPKSSQEFFEDYSSFSNLFDNLPEIQGPQNNNNNGLIVHQPSLNQILAIPSNININNNNVTNFSANLSSTRYQNDGNIATTSIGDNSLKRKRLMNDGILDNEEFQALKKLNNYHSNFEVNQSNFSNQFDMSNQAYNFNQQLPFNSQMNTKGFVFQ